MKVGSSENQEIFRVNPEYFTLNNEKKKEVLSKLLDWIHEEIKTIKIMNYSEYQKQAITTKIYKDEVALAYLALGLGGEAAELFEKIVEQQERDTFSVDQLRLLSKEIGDVFWYLAGLADETGQDLQEIVQLSNVERNPLDTEVDAQESLIIQTGVILEVFKKALRDEYELTVAKELTPTKLEKINIAIATIVRELEYLATFFGIEIGTILSQNVEKLQSRANRGVLGGSGDER